MVHLHGAEQIFACAELRLVAEFAGLRDQEAPGILSAAIRDQRGRRGRGFRRRHRTATANGRSSPLMCRIRLPHGCWCALGHEKKTPIEIIRSSHASIPRGARHWRMITLAYLYSVGRQDPNHDAIMRIESEAPRWRLHSSRRRQVHVQQRKATTSDRH